MTVVRNMHTSQELVYSIPPKEAVVAAYNQYQRNNWNTWTYLEGRAPVMEGKYGWSCGDFWARKG